MTRRPTVISVAVILLWCAVLGDLGGRLWMSRWHAPQGVVSGHTWYPDPWDAGSRADFAATAWFTLIALGLGLATGVLAAWLSRAGELVTLVALVVGSCLAAWLMYRHGVHTAPPDPAPIAKTAKDGTRLIGTLVAPGWSARVCLPLAALIGLGGWFLLLPDRKTVGSDEAFSKA
ncbi:hypothetical protein [Nocardioides sp. Kera G14]|uniref:hypothetical protein n=1 Tax=Nocardioides sp. Kera G14 TaxID=2884264 RepID=UPI001D1227A0|nr:hypothetical protein [Nocardioides sp. Kera G14]UDY22473.1 hypothetical protein LH076_10310 [Nocardioides sp. Kera G14]